MRLLTATLILLLIPPAPAPATGPHAPPAPLDSPLVAAARLFPGVRFHEGTRDPLLTRLAEQYASQMASIDSQSRGSGRRRAGHFGWDERYATIRRELGMRAVEVSAESWPWQAGAPIREIGAEMFRTWRQSHGPYPAADHWGVVAAPHRRYGDGLAKSRTGIWYACIIVAD